MATDYSTSLIRTGTPLIVGFVATFLLRYGVHVDNVTLTSLVTIGLSGGYYAVFRLLELKVSPKFGKLLGSAKAPDYSQVPALAEQVGKQVAVEVPAVDKVLAKYGLLDSAGNLTGTVKLNSHTISDISSLPSSIQSILTNGPGGKL